MSRFTVSPDNLRINVEDSLIEPYVLAASRALRKAGARKVYFVGLSERPYPILNERQDAQFTVLDPAVEPSNFLRSARILHRSAELVVVHSKRLRQSEWRRMATEIEANIREREDAD
jgi:hypothetical protein